MSEELTHSPASDPSDSLASWYEQYMAVDADLISSDHVVIQALESDQLDYDQIELEVQRLVPDADVLGGFCGKCRWLLGHWPGIDESDRACPLGRAVNTLDIEAAAKAGCKFCLYLLSGLMSGSPLGMRAAQLDTIRKIEMRFNLRGKDGTSTIAIKNSALIDYQFLWLNLPGKTATKFTKFGANGARMSGCNAVIERMSPISKLWEEPVEPFDMANMWLDNCCKKHDACFIPRERLPTRLVCVDNNTIRLVISETLQKAPLYATLSYCWGHEPFIKLSRDNLASFLEDIPWDALPPTFKDAIQAVRQLGLQYIWIDALCIVQEPQDWAIEAGHMHSVYSGAFISLAASDAHSVYQGFLQRPHLYNGGFYSRVISSSLCEIRRFIREGSYRQSILGSHLSGRAWAFQEKLLPARTIHFGKSGLWWECQSQLCSEYLPDELSNLLLNSGTSHMPVMRPVHKQWPWSRIVEYYSAANLTYGSDRLAALSGIVARQHGITGGQYLAGLWRESLVEQLTWQVRTTSRKPRPEWRAPTWSWASVDGPVDLPAYGDWSPAQREVEGLVEEYYVQVLQAKTTPSGPDPFGPVDSGELTLSCSYLVRGHLRQAVGLGELNEAIVLDSGLGVYPVKIDCWEDALFNSEGVVYLLPVSRGRSYIMGLPGSGLAIGGLVVDASVTSRDHARRVGSFGFNSSSLSEEIPQVHHETKEYYKKFLAALEKLGDSTTDTGCAQALSDSEEKIKEQGELDLGGAKEVEAKRYIITLV